MPQREPLLANLMGRAASIPKGTPAQVGAVQIAALGQGAEGTTLTLSTTAAEGASRVCHQVAAGETLWRIASQLQAQVGSGSDTYSYLLALVQERMATLREGAESLRFLRERWPDARANYLPFAFTSPSAPTPNV